ncbi:MAG: glycosyltransferase family 2 protein [Nitrosarchaeum sp.]|nr:glycosyltransferase family 2 protein [Nitrosarchaeum sp.]
MDILICIPAFNEENVIGKVVQESLQYSNYVVVCDDGSADDTSIMAEKAGAYVIKHATNLGKGAALKSLFKYAKHFNADVVVTIDGDGQFLPSEIPKLCKQITDGSADVVIGYRFDDETDMPNYRKLGNKVLDHVSKSASHLPFRDTQSGFRAYSKNAVQIIKFTNTGFVADSEILISAAENNLRIKEEKVKVLYSTGTKTSTKNPVSHGTGVLVNLIELVLLKHPLKYLGISGLLLTIFGIINSSYVIALFNESRYFSIPYTLISMGLLTLGILFILVSGILYSINRQIQSRS